MHAATLTATSAADLKAQLETLERERSLAGLTGLLDSDAYRRDLEDEMAATQAAYIGAAVTEIASLRALLDAPLEG
jgi:hypothetical protein